ncbi:MAG: DUF4876 domain-containing protein [Muribaculaceae bacterium]|nr:DUF4876 domain-containing protein [Muribaculaceae bacterium]
MKNSVIYYFLIIAIAIGLTACDDPLTSADSTRLTNVEVNLLLPDLDEKAEVVNEILTFRNVTSGRKYEFSVNSEIDLTPGLYDVSYSARVFISGAATTSLRANASSVSIIGDSATVDLTAYNNIDNDDLIIAEIFFSGTLQSSGNQYYGDDYIKLYNNTDHVIYADGITLFESKFLTTKKYDYSPDIMSEAMTVDALYTVPGSGHDVPVAPGEYLLIADTGIDHRVANPNSFDLSHADFEWYDVSTNPNSLDIDGVAPNMDKWYCYTLSFWLLHNRGFKAYGIARIPVDRDTYLKEYLYTYEYEEITNVGTFPMSQTAYRLPNEWIVDVVNCSVDALHAWEVCAPALDCGWTGCGTMDKDKTRYFHSVRRKLLYVTPEGNAVFSDTNNSSEDFNKMCVPSEIENQRTATDIYGTPAGVRTYDGIVPIP